MKKPQAANAKAAKPKTSAGRPNPKKKAPAKPAHVPAAVRAQRHATAVKAAKTRAANAKKAKAHPRRQLALGSAVACCSAEALAASLRLTGWPVRDSDVLALYWHTARDEHAGASILATLEAAGEFGLAGVRPLWFALADEFEQIQPPLCGGFHLRRPAGVRDNGDGHIGVVHPASVIPGQREPPAPGRLVSDNSPPARGSLGLILGLALPTPHAVLDTGSEWISWGERWPAWAFPDAAIEEAWEVTWPDTR